MELKSSVKSNRIRSSIKSKKSFLPKVEVVTENVFVPITKTVFTKKCGDAIQCNFSVPKVELVKFYQCNNSTKMSLLKKPCLQEKRYANSIRYPKQVIYLKIELLFFPSFLISFLFYFILSVPFVYINV